MAEDVESWANVYQKYRDGDVSQECYEEWKATYAEQLTRKRKTNINPNV